MLQKRRCSQSLTRLPSSGHQRKTCSMSLHTLFCRSKRFSWIKETRLLPPEHIFKANSQHKPDLKRTLLVLLSVVMETHQQIFWDECKAKDDQPRPESATPRTNPTYWALIGWRWTCPPLIGQSTPPGVDASLRTGVNHLCAYCDQSNALSSFSGPKFGMHACSCRYGKCWESFSSLEFIVMCEQHFILGKYYFKRRLTGF